MYSSSNSHTSSFHGTLSTTTSSVQRSQSEIVEELQKKHDDYMDIVTSSASAQDRFTTIEKAINEFGSCGVSSVASYVRMYFPMLVRKTELLTQITAQHVYAWNKNTQLNTLIAASLFAHPDWFMGEADVDLSSTVLAPQRVQTLVEKARNFLAVSDSANVLSENVGAVTGFLSMLAAHLPSVFTPSIFSTLCLQNDTIRNAVKTFIANNKCQWTELELQLLLKSLHDANCSYQVRKSFIGDIIRYKSAQITPAFVVNVLLDGCLNDQEWGTIFASVLTTWDSATALDFIKAYCAKTNDIVKLEVVLTGLLQIKKEILTAGVISDLISSLEANVTGIAIGKKIVQFLENGENWQHWAALNKCYQILEQLEQLSRLSILLSLQLSNQIIFDELEASLKPKFSLSKAYAVLANRYVQGNNYTVAADIIIKKIPFDINAKELAELGIGKDHLGIDKIGAKLFGEILKRSWAADWWTGEVLLKQIGSVEEFEQQYLADICKKNSSLRELFNAEQQQVLCKILGEQPSVVSPSSSSISSSSTSSTDTPSAPPLAPDIIDSSGIPVPPPPLDSSSGSSSSVPPPPPMPGDTSTSSSISSSSSSSLASSFSSPRLTMFALSSSSSSSNSSSGPDIPVAPPLPPPS